MTAIYIMHGLEQGLFMSTRLTRVELTNLDKILYPQLGVAKAQVIEYYIKMAPKMLDTLSSRPIVLNRFPDGADKEGFYEKDAPSGTPSWVETFKKHSETVDRDINYVVCNGLDTLVWLANLAALEIHMTLSKTDSFETPDLVLFDLDPEPPAKIDDVVDIAILLKEKLDHLGFKSYVKTSGKKGLHVVIPITHGYTFRESREFVHIIGKYVARESSVVVSESRSKQPGTVAIDYAQNSHGRTVICHFSLRPTQQATVSTPLEWKHIQKGLKPEKFNINSVVKMGKNPWQGLLENRQKLEAN
jgi:bifunctional non-homologous end joining protein LigD